ncbi:TcfC E-set like domain-containing protein [Stenotrophomonas rhizophila]
MYAQRELGDHFVRAGYFLPTFEGVIRQPRAPGTQNDTALGVMVGSSDILLADTRSASMYPVHVTASRDGVVEVLRDGVLLSTQAVRPGIQEIDTRRLPGGIYEVDLRVVVDGREASREAATIHKPSRWRDPTRRWRYSAFAGQQRGLLGSSSDADSGKVAAGAVVNYLVHPRAVAGATVQQIGQRRAAGLSMDWQASSALSAYTNLYTATDRGRGLDLQGLYRYRAGSVVASHARSWAEQRHRVAPGAGLAPRWERQGGWQDTTAVSITHRFSHRDTASVRITRSSGFTRGTGIDVSYGRRETLFGRHDVNWRVSAHDRPGNRHTGYHRQRGIDLTVSLALGSDRRSYSGSPGSRTGDNGQRDGYLAATVSQHLDGPVLRSVTGTVGADRGGVGAGAGAYLQHAVLEGDAQLYRAAGSGQLSGSANLDSTVAFGGGQVAVIGQWPQRCGGHRHHRGRAQRRPRCRSARRRQPQRQRGAAAGPQLRAGQRLPRRPGADRFRRPHGPGGHPAAGRARLPPQQGRGDARHGGCAAHLHRIGPGRGCRWPRGAWRAGDQPRRAQREPGRWIFHP